MEGTKENEDGIGMSRTLNLVCIEGYVGNEPKYRYTQHNEEVATFVVGTEDLIFNEVKRQWHTIVVVGTEFINLVKSAIRKGVKVRVTGVIYKHRQVAPVYKHITEIIVSDTGKLEIIEEDVGGKYWQD